MWDQKPNGELDRGHVVYQVQLDQGIQQVLVAIQRDPRVKGDEGRCQVDPGMAACLDNLHEIRGYAPCQGS